MERNMEGCPLELKSFTIPDPKSQFIALERLQGNGDGDLLQTLRTLKQDLTAIWHSNDGRITVLQTELGKADAFIKSRMKDIKALGSDIAGQPAPPVLKLKLNAAGQDHRKPSNERNKRKRSRVNLAETDDDDQKQTQSQRRSSVREDSVMTDAQDNGDALQVEEKKAKSIQQIQVETLWKYVEQFYRPISDVDIKALYMVDNDDPAPYIIPKLGKFYHEVWAEEEREMLPGERVTDQVDASCGTLTERILISLVEEDLVQAPGLLAVSESGESVQSYHQSIALRSHTADELNCVEERIRAELQQLGLFEEDSMQVDQDEITLELRRLQLELAKVSSINQARSKVIQNLAHQKMAYQEYLAVLDELNTQIEAHYQKKYKAGISKSKNRRQTFPGLQQRPNHDALQSLLTKRKQLVEEIEPLFSPSIIDVPLQTIFEDEEYRVKDDVANIVIVPDNEAISLYQKLQKPVPQSPLSSAHNSVADLSAVPVGIIQPPPQQVTTGAKKKPRKQKDTQNKELKKVKKPRLKKESSKAASVTSSQDYGGSQTINPAALLGDDFAITGLPDWMLQQ